MGQIKNIKLHIVTDIKERLIPISFTMPPKKKGAEEETVTLGRFGTSLKVGIVGVPNVGKSTFFNVLTNSQIAAENFPFCTIDPNESRVPVPDERYDFLCNYHKPASKVPAFLNVVDIAGLVAGASEGAGLGNAFLSHISACDAIFQMLRAFEDEDVTHVDGAVDPIRDLQTILEELRLKDVEYFEARFNDLEKKCTRAADKSQVEEFKVITKVLQIIREDKKHLRFIKDWSAAEVEVLNKHLPLTAKPMLYLVNLTEKDFIRKKNKWLIKIKQWIDENDPGAQLIPFSAAFELKAFHEDPADLRSTAKNRKCKPFFQRLSKLDLASLSWSISSPLVLTK